MDFSVATLKIDHISKTIQQKKVVDNVSLIINSNQVVGLLGSNGAGKTTLFYIIVGLIAADSGTISLNGTDISKLPIHKRSKLGLSYLPQEASIFKRMTVEDNIKSILELSLPRNKIKPKLKELLNELNINHIKNNLGLSLSGGERRRVEIARALATNPHFILLDEPFAGVDPLSILDIQNIILFLKQKNIGILITDHNVRETLKICNYTYIIKDGKLFSEGPPDELISNEEVKKAYLGNQFIL